MAKDRKPNRTSEPEVSRPGVAQPPKVEALQRVRQERVLCPNCGKPDVQRNGGGKEGGKAYFRCKVCVDPENRDRPFTFSALIERGD